ncbi:hypothetical protein [Taibaiella koreensis]|uniref:hypothetical protein n=1 Tax=Taibaiella koreensis TaxID=1268548 RepID=UPI000E599937|nr:hypothetical protein [Taibaiella koreensis]
MKILFSVVALLTVHIAFGQCKHTWIRHSGEAVDTVMRANGRLEPNPISQSETIDAFIQKVDGHIAEKRIEGTTIPRELDSLKQLPGDSDVLLEIRYLEHELTSQFQIISSDSIGYALYAMDTLTIMSNPIVIYAFSSNFESEWNEDFGNWFFYYTREFGIVEATYVCTMDWNGPCFDEVTLIDNCKINDQNRAIFEKVKRHVLETRNRN